MPDQEIITTDQENELLERVRQQQSLASIQQAAEWLAKSLLRKHARRLSGRGRALYEIDRKPT